LNVNYVIKKVLLDLASAPSPAKLQNSEIIKRQNFNNIKQFEIFPHRFTVYFIS
jgi:hypothetical protein